MAEIHVEPKKKGSNTSWLWIVLALIVAAVVIYFLLNRNTTDATTTTPADTTGSISVPPTPYHRAVLYC